MIFGLVFYKTITSEKKIAGATTYLAGIEQKARTISAMKKAWQDSKTSRQKIESILRHPFMGKAEVSQQVRQGRFKATIRKANKQALDMLTNKILNETLNISTFQIIRENENFVNVTLEIVL